MKDDKITVTETTCVSAPERFSYIACRPVNRIGGGQRLDGTLPFCPVELPRGQREAHDTQEYT